MNWLKKRRIAKLKECLAVLEAEQRAISTAYFGTGYTVPTTFIQYAGKIARVRHRLSKEQEHA